MFSPVCMWTTRILFLQATWRQPLCCHPCYKSQLPWRTVALTPDPTHVHLWTLWCHKPLFAPFLVMCMVGNRVGSDVICPPLFPGCPTPPQSRRRFFLSPKSLRSPWNQRGANGPRVPADSVDNPSALSGESYQYIELGSKSPSGH
jgi:hypothetical protein